VLEQLRALEEGGADSSYFTVPVSAMPALKGRYRTLYSRVEVNERLYNILLEQNEQARITVQEQTPTVSVLDSARVPEIRSRPRRSVIVLGSIGLTLIFSILLAGLLELVGRLEKSSPEDYSRVQRFTAAYFGWLPGIKGKQKP
jgi:capsule polysaccharide export protein KpsE/RkpR